MLYLLFEEGKKAIVSDVANVAKQGEVGGRLLELKVVIGWMCLEMEIGEDLELNRSHDLEMGCSNKMRADFPR